MARGKRRKPIQPQVSSLIEEAAEANMSLEDEGNDDINDFMEGRHKEMLDFINDGELDFEDSDDEPEQKERDVFGMDDSDSDDNGDSEDDEEDADDPLNQEREDRMGWGDKSKAWYGADTHEYEIMEDDEREEALKDEEEEAIRLQKKALSEIVPEDYEYGTDEEAEDSDVVEEHHLEKLDTKAFRETAQSILEASAPEVVLLLKDLEESLKQMETWKSRVSWNETARIMYHLHALLVTNIAYYFNLRTDPSADGVDIRKHPVLMNIVQLRSMLRQGMQLPCSEPERNNVLKTPSTNRIVEKEMEKSKSTSSEAKRKNNEDKNEDGKKKKKKRKKSKSIVDKPSKLVQTIDDENRVQFLLSGIQSGDKQVSDQTDDRNKKRRKLNQIVGAMERERQERESKRGPSADVDYIRDTEKREIATSVGADDHMLPEDDDDDVVSKMLTGKKREREAEKKADAKPHVYRFKDKVDPESRRIASSQVVKNRGLTRYRPREKKTPRTKNRMAYDKAVIRRKGAVREYVGKFGANYSGEASGINISARKGSRLSNV